VFDQPSRYLLVFAITGLLGVTPMRMPAQATAPAAQEPQKNWKDRAEYDLYDAITKDQTPKTRLEKLQQWEKQYPQTEWMKERRTLFLTTYFALQQPKESVAIAKQILAEDPKNFSALFIIVTFTQALAGNNPPADVLDQGEKAARALAENIDATPPNFTADQWKSQRPQVEELAHTTLGWIAMQKKNWQPAEDEFQKSLKLNPNSGQVAYYMGTAIASEKDVKKMPTALFYFARAATYDGAGALNTQGRQQVLDYVKKAYKGYHGSDQDFDKLMAAAKSAQAPPPDFSIKSATELQDAAMKNEADWEQTHPEEATWKKLKDALTGPEGTSYFNSGMKDAQLPTLKGKVVKMEPATKPKTVILALLDGKSDGATPDATLKFEAALPGSVEPGTELKFEGVPESFTASPFMVVFNVDKDKLHGWTGKNSPAAPIHRRPAATKK
jgi:tetratricopeptide (TPR) repeat protein